MAISKLDGIVPEDARSPSCFHFAGLKRVETTETELGDIVAVAGVEGITIGETITERREPDAAAADRDRRADDCHAVQREHFTVRGTRRPVRDFRNLRERLEKELLTNVSLRVEETGSPDTFKVLGRGELQLAILIEMMRREGYELMVGRPEIVTKEVDGSAWSRWSS